MSRLIHSLIIMDLSIAHYRIHLRFRRHHIHAASSDLLSTQAGQPRCTSSLMTTMAFLPLPLRLRRPHCTALCGYDSLIAPIPSQLRQSRCHPSSTAAAQRCPIVNPYEIDHSFPNATHDESSLTALRLRYTQRLAAYHHWSSVYASTIAYAHYIHSSLQGQHIEYNIAGCRL